ncbi:MAG: DUF3048 domain-containing protein [Ruminococcaceae bacterium]|nr:DUF3048 domain-containing protein [Oscillospiraceae bacterium]
MKNYIRLAAFILSVIMLLSAAACGKKQEEVPENTGNETQNEPMGETNIELEQILPEHLNPLTGLEAEGELEGKRPVSVMLNNIHEALPQVGISGADVLFECLAEGSITRLLGVFADPTDVGVIGSIRSSRPYYLDFAQMFDAVYVHAGGSEDAYSQIASRNIDHIDGVRGGGDSLGIFYRDQERLKTMNLEHTMMTQGENIVYTIENNKYRTELREGFEYPFEFAAYGESVKVGDDSATHVYIPISSYQLVDYVYDEEAKIYYRYQYNGKKHIDGGNGEQLSFKNVIVLFCETAPYDTYGRLKVTTTGTGNGYLISEGKYKAINWSRDDIDGNLTLTDANGERIVVNRGKTFINICTPYIEESIEFNATDRALAE